MSGQLVGYARVSTEDQDYQLQVDALVAAGCSKVFTEKQSGTSVKGRGQLEACLEYLREGDTLMVTRVDRLARSIMDLQNLVHELKAKGVALRATEQPIDTSSAAGKAFLDMLGVFAEFETNLRKERQMEGIRKAQSQGKYKGRASVLTDETLGKLKAGLEDGLKEGALMELTGLSRASLYRAKKMVSAE